MNVNFEAALQLINLGNYDKAIAELNKAIDAEMAKDNESTATEYRCVLGELLANLDRKEDARIEFATVVEYCEFSNSLSKQKAIAEVFIKAIDEGKPLPAGSVRPAPKRNSALPLIPKPVQNKSFIAKQMGKRKK